MKKALITGITGQDGSYLAEFLIEKGYEVHGVLRRSSSFNTGRIEHLYLDEWVRDMKKKRLVELHWGDMTDSSSLIRIISEVRPDEIYNLAAQSHVKVSFDVPEFTADTDANGVLRLLEAVRISGLTDSCRIYQASTSELYGKVQEVPQSETTPFYPRSPYGVAKLYGYWMMKNYRESYNMFCCNGILFNHESERRGETFVTRKITLAAARIAQGFQDKLYLGNLNALRDWGYAKDYVECMWLISRRNPTTTSSPQASTTRCANSARRPSRKQVSNYAGKAKASTRKASRLKAARSSSRSTPNISAPPKSTSSSATPQRPNASSAGIPKRPVLKILSALWSSTT